MWNRVLFLLWLCSTGALVEAQNPLSIPDTLTGTEIDLTLQEGKMSFFAGDSTKTMGVNGNLLGPTLIFDKGQFADIKVHNTLPETTTIHWHGMHVSSRNDGGPHTTIAPNSTWNPKFEVMDHAATYWYHPHLHKKTNEHVLKGMAGMIIVRDDEEAALDLPRTYGVDDFPVILQTKAFNDSNQIVVTSASEALDSTIMVNGTLDPYLDVPAQVVRFRFLNGSSERLYILSFDDSRFFHQIGSDGGLLRNTYKRTTMMIAPGERIEVLVDFSGEEGKTLSLKSLASELPAGYYGSAGMGSVIEGYYDNPLNGNDFDIMQINVVAPTANPINTVPYNLSNDKPLEPYIDDVKRGVTFGVASGGNGITGPFGFVESGLFNINKINDTVHLGDTEVWTLANGTMIAHPFHIHDIQFYVIEKNGSNLVPEYEKGRKDVILVDPMGTVKFITKFEDFADSTVPYMYHCHLLTHEDDGMMGQFLVLEKDTSASGVPSLMEGDQEIRLFPNPAKGMLRVQLLSQGYITGVRVFSATGQLIEMDTDHVTNKNLVELDLRKIGLERGLYLIEVSTPGGIYHSRFIKE